MRLALLITIGATLGIAAQYCGAWGWLEPAIGVATLVVATGGVLVNYRARNMARQPIRVVFRGEGFDMVPRCVELGFVRSSFSRAELLGRLGMRIGRFQIAYLGRSEVFSALMAVELGYADEFVIYVTEDEAKELDFASLDGMPAE